MGRQLGVSEAQLRELPHYAASDAFSPIEKRVLDYATALTHTPVVVSDGLFAAMQTRFSEAELVELTAAIVWENFRARFNHAFGIEAQGFSAGAACALPERPPAPAG